MSGTLTLSMSMSATATGSQNPTLLIGGGNLQNGDFLILENATIPTLTTGDGIDEVTEWSFDFSDNSNLDLFSPTTELSSAQLTLTLTPKSGLITTDTTGLVFGNSSEFVRVPNLPNVPSVGQIGTISFDLLDFGFSQSAILNSLNADDSYSIEWSYQDDAIISFAQLELTTETVPESSSLAGVAIALALGGTVLGKRQKSRLQ